MPHWWVVVLAIGATARVTRFLVHDTLARSLRSVWFRRVGDHTLAAELLRCDWCVGIWVALPVTVAAALFGDTPWFWGPALWLSIAFSASVAALVTS